MQSVQRPIRRRRFLAASLAAALLVVSGCTSDETAKPVGPVAATAGGVSIPSTQVDAAGQLAFAVQTQDPPAKAGDAFTLEEVTRMELTQQIQHQLLIKVNNTLATPVTDDAVGIVGPGTAQQLAAQLLVPDPEIKDRIKDHLILKTLLDEAIAKGESIPNVEVEVSMVTYEDRQQAITMRDVFVKNPLQFTDIANSGVAGRTAIQLELHLDPGLASSGLFSSPVGSFAIASVAGNTVVARIDKREVTADPVTASEDSANVDQARVVQGLGGMILAGLAKDLPVTVDAKYGVWDPIVMQVVPTPVSP